MKTSEFKEKLKDYSLYVGESEGYFTLSYCSACIAEVSKTRQGSLSIYSMPFKQLVYTLIEYAETPIEEREEAIKQPVTWQEALEAWAFKGKTIRCNLDDLDFFYKHEPTYGGDILLKSAGDPVEINEIKFGTWYIED